VDRQPETGTRAAVAAQLTPWLAGCIASQDVSRGANLETRPAAARDATSISGRSRTTTDPVVQRERPASG